MSNVSVYYAPGNKRSKTLAEAAYKGLRRIGETAVLRDSTKYTGVVSSYAVFYGLSMGLNRIFEDYKKYATAVYIDLGYWHRRLGGRFNGYHKVIVNSRHPTAYFQNNKHSPERFKALGLKIKPWREKGNRILLAGMSAKAALAEGLIQFQWEKKALESITHVSTKPVTYRPKPNCLQSRPLVGAGYDKRTPLPLALAGCHALVTRQSNTAVDALLEGIPVFCEKGVASVMGESDLSLIDTPYFPEDRQRWAEDIAWCQFTTAEIAEGVPWRHLKDEGLIP